MEKCSYQRSLEITKKICEALSLVPEISPKEDYSKGVEFTLTFKIFNEVDGWRINRVCLTKGIFTGDIGMTKKTGLSEARERMERKGTVGAFTAQAKKGGGVKKGGGIKDSFVEKELKSSNPTTRKRAQFAKNMKAIARGK